MIVAPDAGFAKEARSFADYLHTPVAIGDKTRVAHDEKAKILDVIGNVEGKNCLVVDDFSISGGTIVEIAQALKAKGAKKIYAALSHFMCREKAMKALNDSPIELLISTDTVENPYAAMSDRVRIVSAAPLFAEAVLRIHKGESVSPMFKQIPLQVIETLKK